MSRILLAAACTLLLISCTRTAGRELAPEVSATPLPAGRPEATAPDAGPAQTGGQSEPAPAAPRLTPEESGRIVFAALDGGIYTVAPDGAGNTLLARPTGPPDAAGFRGSYAWPVWSPDGETILFSSLVPGGRRGLDVSLRTVPVAGGSEALVYRDDPGTSGIGSGVAHFAYWSPDSRRIAVIAGTASGLTGEVVNVASGAREATLADGAPIYYSWASDSRRILVHHQEILRLYEFDHDGKPAGAPRQIGSMGSADYYAPAFSPDGDRVLHGEATAAGTGIFSTGFDGARPTLMMTTAGRAAFGWAPDGRRVAVLSGEADGLFSRLTVMSAGGLELFRVNRQAMISHWWAPDGNRLAVTAVEQGPGGNAVLVVSVLDVRDQSETRVAELLPSDEFLFMQVYFDQYAHSMRLWSPDSRYVLLFGALGDRLAQTAGYSFPRAPSGSSLAQASGRGTVWVVDVTGVADPAPVGNGYIGSWSPR